MLMSKYLVREMKKMNGTSRGDTIIEVLIAIAIAAFAISISYGTANRSLRQAVTAGERNTGLNYVENQLADLKLRYQKTPTISFNQFTFNYSLAKHFCLDDTATDPTASNWGPISNDSSTAQGAPLQSSGSPNASAPYNNSCVRNNSGTAYYIDIATQNSSASPYPTIYQINVRWERLGGGQPNQSSIYYRF